MPAREHRTEQIIAKLRQAVEHVAAVVAPVLT
jgi:hypothetical protein